MRKNQEVDEIWCSHSEPQHFSTHLCFLALHPNCSVNFVRQLLYSPLRKCGSGLWDRDREYFELKVVPSVRCFSKGFLKFLNMVWSSCFYACRPYWSLNFLFKTTNPKDVLRFNSPVMLYVARNTKVCLNLCKYQTYCLETSVAVYDQTPRDILKNWTFFKTAVRV